ncbi:MAG: head-tail adaptor protein [Acidobacteriia bacterium]|nr:head-tail adaptor protein [Terriglobia bacterium]
MPRQRPVVEVIDGWPELDAGRLIHRVEIWTDAAASPPKVGPGGPVMVPVLFADGLNAAIEVLPGREVIRSGQDTAQTFVIVTMHYIDGVLPQMRVKNVAKGSMYLIQVPEDVEERGVVLQLRCIGLGANT